MEPIIYSTSESFEQAVGLALRGHWEELEELLCASQDVAEVTDNHGQTLLHIVAGMDGAARTIKKIIALNAGVNRADESGAVPLGNAIHGGHRRGVDTTENIEVLVSAGADLSKFDETGNPPLHAAIYERRPDVIEILLAAGADPLQKNIYGDDAYAYIDWLRDARIESWLPPRSGCQQ